jgi:hypothetical protein
LLACLLVSKSGARIFSAPIHRFGSRSSFT